jgi:ABC-type nitrate/sulfonate/bicarbonate transport system substrate-binding protein
VDRLRLAYRDDDRTPVIYCIQAMARAHYALDVEVLQIRGTREYEAALFDGACDVIIEHLEYLYGDPSLARQVSMFCAPVLRNGLELVVRPEVQAVADLRGTTIAIRSHGRPHAIMLRLRKMGLEGQVATTIVRDEAVGRWAQWKTVADGTCGATFVSRLYLPPALDAGLKVLDAPDIEVVGHYSQACLTRFGAAHPDVMRRYVQSVVHALALLRLRRAEALAIARGEPMRRMRLSDEAELERQFDAIVDDLLVRPYPTPEAVANTYAIATAQYGGAGLMNPLSVWDLHWLRELEAAGFVDGLLAALGGEQRTDGGAASNPSVPAL